MAVALVAQSPFVPTDHSLERLGESSRSLVPRTAAHTATRNVDNNLNASLADLHRQPFSSSACVDYNMGSTSPFDTHPSLSPFPSYEVSMSPVSEATLGSFSDPGHYALPARISAMSFITPFAHPDTPVCASRHPPHAHTRQPLDASEGVDETPGEPSSSHLVPKSPIRTQKSVYIIEPTAISHGTGRHFYAASEPGHSTTSHSSDRVPAYRRLLTSQSSPTSTSLFSSDTAVSASSSTDVAMLLATADSLSRRRNKLRKSRPSAAMSTESTSPSAFRWRSSSSLDSGSCRPSLVYETRDRVYRSVSESGHGIRPTTMSPTIPTSRDTGSTSTSCGTSGATTPSFCSRSTPATTPDSNPTSADPLANFPQESQSSQLGGRSNNSARKLQKKRPPLAPSGTFHSPSGAPTGPSTDAKLSEQDCGQLLPLVSPQSPFWTSIPLDTQVDEPCSPLSPIIEGKNHSGSHALAQLACTGLCSSSFAALTSHLTIRAQSPERLFSVSIPAWDDSQSGVFNPYTECSLTDDVSPASSSSDHPRERIDSGYSSAVQRDAASHGLERDLSSSGSSSKSCPILEAKPRISKFTVVNGYRDRSSTAMRRWTLAMADVPDDVLVKQLDKLRKEDTGKSRGRASGLRSVDGSQFGHGDDRSMERKERASSFVFGGPQETRVAGHWKSEARLRVGDDHDADGDVDSEEEAVESDHEEDEEDWKTASKVIFCCRELVRTERNYQARMRELLAMESSHPLFAFVLEYVPDLLYASETLLAHLIDDPSAWGVSAAFIGCEEELEAALVAWSRVVGEFFTDGEREKHGRKLTKRMPGETTSSLGHGEADSRSRSVTRTMSTLGIPTRSQSAFHLGKTESLTVRRYSMNAEATGNGLFTAALGTGLAFGLSPPQQPDELPKHEKAASQSARALTRTITAWKRKSMPSSLSNLHTSPNTPQSSMHVSSTYGAKRASDLEKKLTVRDLAIQPIQRVMRYVLQYRDLLDHTPTTSPSRGLVERAHDSALRIAQKCDRAQTHAAFLRRP